MALDTIVSVSRSLSGSYQPRDCGKEKESSVKPLNMGGRLIDAQCLFIRQCAHGTVEISHLNDKFLLMHRVIPRSWEFRKSMEMNHGFDSGSAWFFERSCDLLSRRKKNGWL